MFRYSLTEPDNAYDHILEASSSEPKEPYEVYHLLKRGKQHLHVGSVEAGDPNEAMWAARHTLKGGKQVFKCLGSTNQGHSFYYTGRKRSMVDAAR